MRIQNNFCKSASPLSLNVSKKASTFCRFNCDRFTIIVPFKILILPSPLSLRDNTLHIKRVNTKYVKSTCLFVKIYFNNYSSKLF